MADIEKTITRLRILRTRCATNLDYKEGLSMDDCRTAVKWLDDALELLRERELVEPLPVGGDTRVGYECTKCHCYIDARYEYCPNCGRKVKWE